MSGVAPASARIGDLIEVPPVRTVVRLAEGRSAPRRTCASFVFTADVDRHVNVVVELLRSTCGRGVFVRGDFGSGKSHFLAALDAWLSRAPGAEALLQAHPGLAALTATGPRLLPVPVSLVDYRASTPLERILVARIEEELRAGGAAVRLTPQALLLEHLRVVLAAPGLAAAFAGEVGVGAGAVLDWVGEHPDEAYLAGWRFLTERGLLALESLVPERRQTLERALAAVAAAGFGGLVLLVDELSEFLRSKDGPERLNEDARTLQLFGELAGQAPLWLFAAVQEHIEQTGDISGPTLRKIKDRYPVVLQLSTVHIRDLIARRLVRRRPGADAAILQIHADYRAHFPTFTTPYDRFRSCYPVHPATLELLEGLSPLFSQHRGVVDFVHARLTGDPERGIPGILERPATELLAPDAIFDHFAARLAEFSDFHVYPRHVVPHLDRLIDVRLAEADRELARRLVRTLVLYAIHPTARPPTVRELTELGACLLAPQDPDLGAQFVAEAILAPLAAASPFLRRESPTGGDPLDAVYALSAEHDPGRTLAARVERAAADIEPDDSRLLKGALADLPVSEAWPGLESLSQPGQPLAMEVVWRQTRRRALVAWRPPGDATTPHTLAAQLASGAADLAVVLAPGAQQIDSPHTLVWRIPRPTDEHVAVLREQLATRQVATALQPDNPADAPLLPLAESRLQQLELPVREAVLATLYAGGFEPGPVPVEPAVRHLRRFGRLLELAAAAVLEQRYPDFASIEPLGATPSARLYQRLFADVVVPGSLSLTRARAHGLSEAIEALAVPLGLVELRQSAYRLAPDPAGHPFLSHVFGLLPSSGAASLADVRQALATGPYGVPADTIAFLLACLAHAGLVSLLAGGRRVALELLDPLRLDRVEQIAPGEMIGRADRATLTGSCPFLAPPGGGWDAFGLRQQREAWQAALRWRPQIEDTLARLERQLSRAAEYSAFAGFDSDGLRDRARRLGRVAAEIKSACDAREGLERFLGAWRGSGLEADDVAGLERLDRFLDRSGEQLVAVAAYVRHPAFDATAAQDPELEALRQALEAMLADPLQRVVADEGRALTASFEAARSAHQTAYEMAHAAHARAQGPPVLDRATRRSIELLRGLREIAVLDRPPGLESLLRSTAGPREAPCRRSLAEALLRSPSCGCGFVPGAEPPAAPRPDPAAAIEAGLRGYREILAAPAVTERLRAHAFALVDMEPDRAAALRELCELLADPASLPPAAMTDRLDPPTIAALDRALAGTTALEPRELAPLIDGLAGRRLAPERIRQLVEGWLGDVPAGAVVAVGEAAPGGAAVDLPLGWWPRLHRGLPLDPGADAEVTRLAAALEARHPVADLRAALARSDDAQLWRLCATEPIHAGAVRAAWERLAGRALASPERFVPGEPSSSHVLPREAAAIGDRLAALRDLALRSAQPMPEPLQARLAIAAVSDDPWATRELARAALAAAGRSADVGRDWLASLPPVAPLDPAAAGVLLVADGVPADVWLAALSAVVACAPARTRWQRLDAQPSTVAGLSALLGVPADRDPTDELNRHGAAYHQLMGTERGTPEDLLPPFPADRLAVVRLARLDQAAHAGELTLPRMPEVLTDLLQRWLPPLLARARAAAAPLVLTTDHGLGWGPGGLSHGAGGVYEQAIFRAEWDA